MASSFIPHPSQFSITPTSSSLDDSEDDMPCPDDTAALQSTPEQSRDTHRAEDDGATSPGLTLDELTATLQSELMFDETGCGIDGGGHSGFHIDGNEVAELLIVPSAADVGYPLDRWTTVSACDLDTPQPSTRGRHTAVLDEAHDQLVIFGGQNYDLQMKFNSVARFDLQSTVWTAPAVAVVGTAPKPRSSHASVLYNNKLYVVGGTTTLGLPQHCEKDNNVWTLDLAANAWEKVEMANLDVCAPRYGHTAVVVDNGKLILHGGMTNLGPEAHTYEFDLENKKVTRLATEIAAEPCAKCASVGNGDDVSVALHICPASKFNLQLHVYGHSAVYHNKTSSMYIFGGTGQVTAFSQLLARLDMDTNVWSIVQSKNAPPDGRYVHCAALDTNDNMYIFGGFTRTYRNDLHAYNIQSGVWRALALEEGPRPVPRSGASLTADPRTGCLYMFGGCDDVQYYNDVWSVPTRPTPRTLSDLVADALVGAMEGRRTANEDKNKESHDDDVACRRIVECYSKDLPLGARHAIQRARLRRREL
eukprot:PhM_4_TR4753/c0_g1_i1/m.2855